MKNFMKVTMAVCFLCLFTACAGGDKLTNYTEEQLKTATIEVLDMFKEGNYDGVVDQFADELKGGLTGAELQKAWEDNFKEAGAFVEYGEFSYSEKKENGFVIAITNYEHSKIQFTISFNKDMKLTNFFMK